jgi:hypothetical protein
VPSSPDCVVGRYASLDALFAALEARDRPLLTAGCVRVHPTLLPERALADRILVRERLAAHNIQLVISGAVAPEPVELRRVASTHSTSHSRFGARPSAEWGAQ